MIQTPLDGEKPAKLCQPLVSLSRVAEQIQRSDIPGEREETV